MNFVTAFGEIVLAGKIVSLIFISIERIKIFLVKFKGYSPLGIGLGKSQRFHAVF
jgi:hypothetical protein